MIIPSSKSNKIIPLKINQLEYQHKFVIPKKSTKRTTRGRSRLVRPTNYMKQDIIAGNSRFDSRETSKSHKYTTNNSSNIETFDNPNQIEIPSLSRGQNPINIEESNKMSIIESERTDRKCEKIINNQNINSFPGEMNCEVSDMHVGIYPDNISGENRNYFIDLNNISNENDCNNCPTSDSGKYLNDDWRYSRSNWNNYSQIDNQSYSNQHHNNDLSKKNDYYYHSIYKCENCKVLILQNENAQSEIRKLKSDNENGKEIYRIEILKLNAEIEYLKSNNKNLQSQYNYLYNSKKHFTSIYNYKSEMNKYESKIRNFQSENSKLNHKNIESDELNKNLENQINNLESENKFLHHLKIENKNLKSQITKCVSKIRKYKTKNKKMKDKKGHLARKCKSLNSRFVGFNCGNIDLNKDFPTENDDSAINKYESDINSEIIHNKLDYGNSETDNITRNFTADNEMQNVINQEVVSNNEPKVIERELVKPLKLVKPLGFANPKGYCYLNSVVQVLGSCKEFKKDIYNYKWISTEKTKDSIFVEGLFNLIRAIEECNSESLDKYLIIVQQNITESSFGDDVYKCFMNLLTRVSNVVKTSMDRPPDHFASLPITLSEKAKNSFTRFKNKNPGFVFDHFYGQLTFQTVCTLCNFVCNESFQMMKSLPLPVPKLNYSVTLNSCIDLFFNESEVEVDDPMKCECTGGSTMSLKSITKLTHGPTYLFIYLNRGSYTDDGDKNNTRITCDDLIIDIKTSEDKSIKYKLISVIDHIGDSAGGHYYCKCSFETEEWWLLNDSQVKRLENKNNVVTDKTIVFLFKITS